MSRGSCRARRGPSSVPVLTVASCCGTFVCECGMLRMPITALNVVLLLLPLRLQLEDLAPVGGLHVDDEGILRNGLAPADGIADRGVVIAHGDGAIGAERRRDLHAG